QFMSGDSPSDWWKTFHVPEMGDVLLERSNEQLDLTVQFLARELGVGEGEHVFDQCCGIGSLSIPLAKAGIKVTGCDQFEPYIERARQDAAIQLPEPSLTIFHSADAFFFKPKESCDAGFNWYSSFGYAPEDTTNQKMLQRAFDALKPGGRFALDIPQLSEAAPGV
ncbi:MAG: methyltransferase domain-containing protein, partial [Planctomycetota bacterium]